MADFVEAWEKIQADAVTEGEPSRAFA
jgi:proteasome regulatory subunit